MSLKYKRNCAENCMPRISLRPGRGGCPSTRRSNKFALRSLPLTNESEREREREPRASREKNAVIFNHHCSGLPCAICYPRLPNAVGTVGGLKRSHDVSCIDCECNLIFVKKNEKNEKKNKNKKIKKNHLPRLWRLFSFAL